MSRKICIFIIIVLLAFSILSLKSPSATLYEISTSSDKENDYFSVLLNPAKWKSYETDIVNLVGYRSIAVKAFNELRFIIGGQRPSKDYMNLSDIGLIPVDTIVRHNARRTNPAGYSISGDNVLEKLYWVRTVSNGVPITLVLPPTKLSTYPSLIPKDYLDDGPDIPKEMDVGYKVNQAGFGVIDLRNYLLNQSLPDVKLYTKTGFHWSYYSGCIAMSRIVSIIRPDASSEYSNGIYCNGTKLNKSIWADNDIINSMNLLFPETKISDSTMPRFNNKYLTDRACPKLLIIGDSYSDQLIYNYVNYCGPEKLIFYDYLKMRKTFPELYKPDMPINASIFDRNQFDKDIMVSDNILIVLSDGNIEGINNFKFADLRRN